MIVECTTCPVRGQRCDDCVVTVLMAFGSPERTSPPETTSHPETTHPETTSPPERTSATKLLLDAAENHAVSMFVGAGLLKAEAAAGLCARREVLEQRGAVRAVG